MPDKIKLLKQRLIIAKGILEIFRLYASEDPTGPRFGSHADNMLLGMAIGIGQGEGRLMGASKLAEFCGMPRATVIRKLEEWERGGVLERVGGKYRVRAEVANSERAIARANAVKQHILDIAAKLSKLDSQGVADQ